MLQEWISVFQLGAALSLVLGGYANHRDPRQEKIESWIKEASQQIEELKRNDGLAVPKQVPDEIKLDKAHWADMSTTDLNNYRRDVTARYFDTVEKFKQNDRIRQIILLMNGIFSAIALVTASAYGAILIPTSLAIGIASFLLGVPVALMITVWLEDAFLRQQASPADGKKAKLRSRVIKVRSDPSPGQTFHVFAEIRRRFRAKTAASNA